MLLEKHLEDYALGVTLPKRVLISKRTLNAVAPRKARRFGVRYDMILIRKDGWSLGFPRAWWNQAHALYPSDWIAVIDLTAQSIRRLGSSLPVGVP